LEAYRIDQPATTHSVDSKTNDSCSAKIDEESKTDISKALTIDAYEKMIPDLATPQICRDSQKDESKLEDNDLTNIGATSHYHKNNDTTSCHTAYPKE